MKIYETKTAPNPRRVRLFLQEKGLLDRVEFIEVDIQKGENLTPEFIAMNPMKKVPVLALEDGSYVAETMAICRYIEEAFPDTKPLLGQTAKEKAAIEQWIRWVEFHFMVPTGMCFQHGTGYFKDRMKVIPEWGEVCRDNVISFMDFLNETLAKQAFVAGENFSAADINAFTTLDFCRVIKLKPSAEQPHLLAWYERMQARFAG